MPPWVYSRGNIDPVISPICRVAGGGGGCSLDIQKLADVDDWTSPINSGDDRMSSCSINAGVITEQAFDALSGVSDIRLHIYANAPNQWKRWTRTFGLDGVQIGEASELIDTPDNFNAFIYYLIQGSTNAYIWHKFAAGNNSQNMGWANGAVIGNRALERPPNTSAWLAGAGLSQSAPPGRLFTGTNIQLVLQEVSGTDAMHLATYSSESPASNPASMTEYQAASLNTIGEVLGHDANGNVYVQRGGLADGTAGNAWVVKLTASGAQLDEWDTGVSALNLTSFVLGRGRFLVEGTTAAGVSNVYELVPGAGVIGAPVGSFVSNTAGRVESRYVDQELIYLKGSNELYRVASCA